MSKFNKKAFYPTDLKDAIIGLVEQSGQQPKILLDKEKCINILISRDKMNIVEAETFFEENILGAYVGKGTPCFATLIKDKI
jgi:hypothetical protein